MHLDNEYRRRWELYHTKTNIFDSREINYKEITEQVIKIETHVEGQVYIAEGNVIRWRFGGFHHNGKVKIDEWVIGTHDDTTCYMQVIQFKDGSMEKKEYPLKDFKVHLK